MSEFQAWLIFFTALGGVVVAFRGISSARKTARQQATLEFMNEYNNSSEVSEGIRMIHQITDDPDSPVARNFKDRNLPDNKDRMNILLVLNKFEVLAIGLKRKIYDLSKPIIDYIREYEADEKACEEFENLANEMKKRR